MKLAHAVRLAGRCCALRRSLTSPAGMPARSQDG